MLAVASVIGYLLVQKDRAPEKQVFINAHVLTMDKNNSVVQAIAVAGDTIVAVGSNEEIKAYIDDETIVHQLAGKTLLPGFIDAHSHFPGLGTGTLTVDLNSPPIGDIESIDGILERLSQALAAKKNDKWLIGVGYDDTLLKEKRHVTRDDLDKVSDKQPILLLHVSGHIVAVNSMALTIAQLDDKSVAPKGGEYLRDSAGRLTGVVEETARIPLLELAFDLSFFDFIDMVKQGGLEYAAAGVTTAQSGLTREPQLKGFGIIDKLGMIPQRLVVWPDMETGKRWVAGEFDPQASATDNVKVGAVKLVADGSIQGFTGYLTQAYHRHDSAHSLNDNYAGYASMESKELNQTVLDLHKKGIQIAVHANGDAAIEMVISAVKLAQLAAPRTDARHIVIHSQMATDAQLKAMKKWGLTPSFFNTHTYYWGDRHAEIFLGPQRASQISPAQSALAIDLPFTLHLDTPVVPMQPLFAVYAAVNRVTSSGHVLGEEQRIDTMSALRAVTIDAAWQMFLEQETGSIEVGKKADLVIIDGDPLADPKKIHQLAIVETFVNGLSIFSAN